MRSTSSVATVGALQKLREAVTFLNWRLAEGSGLDRFDSMLEQLQADRAVYEQFTGNPFQKARFLEIGYGARPFRLMALQSLGIDACGIDLDRPMLRFSPANLFRILRTNGFERAVKTAARSLLFDRKDRSNLGRSLRQRGFPLVIDPSRFLVGDASTFEFGPRRFECIYSTDVFEHIPVQNLERLIRRIPSLIAPGGIAIITPNIFTGITGGHLPEWYGHLVDSDETKTSEPWEHLRKKRFAANSYLNGLSRAGYRDLFSRDFEILDERVLAPDLGRRWLTPLVRAELSAWSDEELFSNQVEFVLRPKSQPPRNSSGNGTDPCA